MEGWDLVFTTGMHTDANGNKKLWTTDDLDKIVSTFNPKFHEPPLVIGHPSNNAPAFGWVEGAKRVGEGLYLKYRQVVDEFKEWNRKGMFKKKSISVYPDGSLRHIGYLGGMPPAIKGLPDYQFSDSGKGEAVTYEFSDWRMSTLGRVVMKLRDYLVEKEGAEKADSIIGSWEVQDLLTPPPEQEPISESCYHEEVKMEIKDVEAIVTKAVADGTQQFSEQLKTISEENKTLRTELAGIKESQTKDREATMRREFGEFLMTPDMQRRVAEGSREATINHMMTLVSAQPLEFGEGDHKVKVPAVDHYKKQLQALPPVVEFNEVATHERGRDRQTNEMDIDVTASKAQEFVTAEAKAGRTISFTEAVAHVKKEKGDNK
ncbi:MAG: hypothetical protein M0T70_02890 [Geobacteraceae bacterium]|nr:hypothetical protein [Geobacteraceae bacterium]